MSIREALQPGFLSIKNAAAYADVSIKTIQRWIKAGLPVYQGTGRGKVLIRPADIDAYLTRRKASQVDLNEVVKEVLRDLGQVTGGGIA